MAAPQRSPPRPPRPRRHAGPDARRCPGPGRHRRRERSARSRRAARGASADVPQRAEGIRAARARPRRVHLHRPGRRAGAHRRRTPARAGTAKRVRAGPRRRARSRDRPAPRPAHPHRAPRRRAVRREGRRALGPGDGVPAAGGRPARVRTYRAARWTQLFEVQKDVVRGVLRQLGVEPAADVETRLAQQQTSSFPAFLAFSQGLQAEDEGDYDQADALYAEAVRLDPGFALAARYGADAGSAFRGAGDAEALLALIAAVLVPRAPLPRAPQQASSGAGSAGSPRRSASRSSPATKTATRPARAAPPASSAPSPTRPIRPTTYDLAPFSTSQADLPALRRARAAAGPRLRPPRIRAKRYGLRRPDEHAAPRDRRPLHPRPGL